MGKLVAQHIVYIQNSWKVVCIQLVAFQLQMCQNDICQDVLKMTKQHCNEHVDVGILVTFD